MKQLRFLFLIVFIIGAYLNLSLIISENIFIPNFICYFACAPLFVIHFSRFIRTRFLYCLLFVLIISCLSMLFSPNQIQGIVKEKLLAFAQLFLTLLSFFSILLTLNRIHPSTLKELFKVGLFVMLIGVFFERFIPGFAWISDSFRFLVYETNIYDNKTRDINMVGFIRPKFFSREPSFVSHFIVLFSLCWYFLSRNKFKTLLLLVVVAYSILLTGSVKILILLPMILIANYRSIMNFIYRFHIFFLSLIFIICLCLSPIIYYTFGDRISSIISGNDMSSNLRIVIPFLILLVGLVKYPFFGIGLGGKENSLSIFDNILTQFGYNNKLEMFNELSFHNFIFETFHFFGLFGTFLLYYVLNKFFLYNLSRSRKITFWLVLFILSFMGGGFVSIRTWVSMAFIYFCIRFRNYNSLAHE